MSTLLLNDRYEEDRAMSLLACDQYLREVTWIEATEPLEPEEEAQLLARLLRARREPGNAHLQMLVKHARERLVEGYQSVVINLARKAFGFRGMEFLDLVNEGNLGLLRAIDRYTEAYSFKALAILCIRGALWDARCEKDQEIYAPHYIRSLYSRIGRARVQWSQAHQKEMTVADLASQLEESETHIEEALCLDAFQQIKSLQGMLREDDAEDYHDFVPLYTQAVVDEDERRESLSHVFEQELTARQCEVMELRYGLSEGVERPRGEVAKELGITGGGVWKIERVAMRRLAKALEPMVRGEWVVGEGSLESQKQYYSTQEAACVLGMSTTTVCNYIRQGRLSAIRCRNRHRDWFQISKQAVHELAECRREAVSA